jgi:hypothetical protein
MTLQTMLEKWWEVHPDAGPAQMPHTGTGPSRPCLKLCLWKDGVPVLPDSAGQQIPEGTEASEMWAKAVRDFNAKYMQLPGQLQGDAGALVEPSAVVAGPDFSDAPWLQSPRPVWEPSPQEAMPDFIVTGSTMKQPGVKIGIERGTNALFLYMGDEADSDGRPCTLVPQELLGFGRGEFFSGTLQNVRTKQLPCIITADTQWVIFVEPPAAKQVVPLATLLFSCCRSHGIPDVMLGQHTLAKRAEFNRYDVVANADGLHFYFAPDEIKIQPEMRPTELGAAWLQSMPAGPLPSLSEHVHVAWELSLNTMPPATLDFIKPKMWLTTPTFLKPGLYYKLC